MIRPLLVDFMSAFEFTGLKASCSEGREITAAVCDLTEKIAAWALTQPTVEISELSACNVGQISLCLQFSSVIGNSSKYR